MFFFLILGMKKFVLTDDMCVQSKNFETESIFFSFQLKSQLHSVDFIIHYVRN